MKTIYKLAAFFFASALYATSATAGLITNGGFEDGFDGWTVTYSLGCVPNQDTKCDFFAGDSTDPGFIPYGDLALYIGCAQLCSAFQIIDTTPGQSYKFSFEYGNNGEAEYEFAANFGDLEVFHPFNDILDTGTGFEHHTFNVTAIGPKTKVKFIGSNPGGWLALDNVSVEAIPEPGSLALLAAGLAGLGSIRRWVLRQSPSRGGPAPRPTAPR
jgi:hypothetical protein